MPVLRVIVVVLLCLPASAGAAFTSSAANRGSSARAADAFSAPESTSAPVVSGDAVVDELLTASDGGWSRNADRRSYQWLRCSASTCTPIEGETAPRYRVDGADLGATLRVRVRAENGAGAAEATSTSTPTVARPTFTADVCDFTPTSTAPSVTWSTAFACAGVRQVFGTTSTPMAGHRLSYRTPAGVSLLGGELQLAYELADEWSTTVATGADAGPQSAGRFHTCWANASTCLSRGQAFDGRLTIPPGPHNGLTLTVHCHIPDSTRSCGAVGAWQRIAGARLTLRDDAPPTVTSATGTLLTATEVGGEELALDVAATDTGTGLAPPRIRLDDEEVTRDARTWPEGEHRLHVVLKDHGGNAVTLTRRTVRVRRDDPAAASR